MPRMSLTSMIGRTEDCSQSLGTEFTDLGKVLTARVRCLPSEEVANDCHLVTYADAIDYVIRWTRVNAEMDAGREGGPTL